METSFLLSVDRTHAKTSDTLIVNKNAIFIFVANFLSEIGFKIFYFIFFINVL